MDSVAGRLAAAYAFDTLGARRAAVVYRPDPRGRGWAAAFSRAFRARGGLVVARDPYLPGVTEWPAYARALARTSPDVVLFPGDARDGAPFRSALQAAGVRAPFVDDRSGR